MRFAVLLPLLALPLPAFADEPANAIPAPPTLTVGIPHALRQPLEETLVLPYRRGWSDAYRNRAPGRNRPEPDRRVPARPVAVIDFDGALPVEADVVYMPAGALADACAKGRLQKIDWNRIGEIGQYLDAAVTDCGVGAAVWAMLPAYDPAVFAGAASPGPAPAVWADVFDIDRIKGARALPDTARDTLEIALLADGVAAVDVYDLLETPAGVDRAFAALDRLKPAIVWWKTPEEASALLAEGKAVIAAAPSMSLLNRNEATDTGHALVWGAGFYQIDAWAIPQDAKHPAEAMTWLGFAAQPENQSELPKAIRAGITHLAAIEQVSPIAARDTPTSPGHLSELMPSDADFWARRGPALEKRFRDWRAAAAQP